MKTSATIPRGTSKTFSSARYLERLMGELDRAAISVRLHDAREQAGLTQAEMGEMLSVHWRTIQDWESPKMRNVPFDRLDEWAAITGTEKGWLLHGEQPEAGMQQRLAELEARDKRIESRLDEILRLLQDPAGSVPEMPS